MDDVFRLASTLRQRHGQPGERVTFTHVPCRVDPATVVGRLRASTLADLAVPEGTRLNHPERPYYGPVTPVVADKDHLTEVWVTASTWEPPDWDFTRAELALRLVYQQDEAKAQSCLTMQTRDGRPPLLTWYAYDNQRAESGYEGDDRLNRDATTDEVSDFLDIVTAATAE